MSWHFDPRRRNAPMDARAGGPRLARQGRLAAYGAGIALAIGVAIVPGRAQGVTELVSVNSSDAQADLDSYWPILSATGRFVLFTSAAFNLAPNAGVYYNVYVHDRANGRTTLVSVSTTGGGANRDCTPQSITPDGRFVGFSTIASNLVAGDTNNAADAFVRDMLLGTTERVSVTTSGAQSNGGGDSPVLSADGRYVAFRGFNLSSDDVNGYADIYLRDRLAGTTVLVSRNSSGQQALMTCYTPSISPDGRFVAFETASDNIVPGTYPGPDVFVRDLVLGTTILASAGAGGVPGNLSSFLDSNQTLSNDGRFLVYSSESTNFGQVDANGNNTDVFVHDLLTGANTCVSLTSTGVTGSSYSHGGAISGNGRFVAYTSLAGDLAPGDNNAALDTFLWDSVSGTSTLISVTPGGAVGAGGSDICSISDDGRFVAFSTTADDIVAADTNYAEDVFVRDLSPWLPEEICFGDGSGLTCPCSNSGRAGNGCANSLNVAGAHLAAHGAAILSNDTLSLAASGMPDGTALYVQGTARLDFGSGKAFADGLRCVGGTRVNMRILTNFGGASQLPEPMGPTISTLGSVTAPGTRVYQVWYRDAASFCTPRTFNLTNAIEVAWAP